MKHGHVTGTKNERRSTSKGLESSAMLAWQFFGPQGTIAPNTLPEDHIAWQLFAAPAEEATVAHS